MYNMLTGANLSVFPEIFYCGGKNDEEFTIIRNSNFNQGNSKTEINDNDLCINIDTKRSIEIDKITYKLEDWGDVFSMRDDKIIASSLPLIDFFLDFVQLQLIIVFIEYKSFKFYQFPDNEE